MDITTLTSEDLDDLRRAVLAEQERRKRIADTPAQVAQLARAYEHDGGDTAMLVDAIESQEQT